MRLKLQDINSLNNHSLPLYYEKDKEDLTTDILHYFCQHYCYDYYYQYIQQKKSLYYINRYSMVQGMTTH